MAWARTPQSNAEIADRLNEITFGGALMAEMRAIAFVQDLIEKGAITGEFGKDSQTDKPYAPHEDQDPAILTNACFDHHHGGGHH